MKLSVLNISPIVLSAILSTRVLAAEELDTRVSQLERKMKQVRTETALGNYTASSASAIPQNEGYGLFVTADLVLWKLFEGSNYNDITNTNFTTNGNTSVAPSTIVTNQAIDLQRNNVEFRWDFGFKAGVGYVMADDNWDAYFNYTQFQTSASASTYQTPIPVTLQNGGVPSAGGIVPNFQDPVDSNNSAQTHRKINLYMADLELGKSFFITKYFSTRPFIGAKTAWIHQKLRSENDFTMGGPATSTGNGFQALAADGTTLVKINGRNNFWGIGPRVGIDINWFFSRNVNLYSNLSGSILWGNFKVHQNETTTAEGNITGIPTGGGGLMAKASALTSPFTNELKASPHRFVPTVQFEMGIEFNIPFWDNAYNFGMKAGYENQYWWRQNFLTNLSYHDVLNPNSFNGEGIIDFPAGIMANSVAFPVTTESIAPEPRLDSPDDLGFHGFTLEFRLDF